MKRSFFLKSIIVILTLTGLIYTSCEKLELNKEFILNIGETKKVNSHLSFKIDSLWDSRCPVNMYCITGGDVNLFFNIEHSNDHIYKVISFNENRNHPFSYDGYLWKILEVKPYPFSTETIDPLEFSIKMVLTKD